MKTCRQCKEERELSEFSKTGKLKDALKNTCKMCVRANSKKHYESNKRKYANRYSSNREGCAKANQKWVGKNKDKVTEYRRKYYQKNRVRIVKRVKDRRESVPIVKLAHNLRRLTHMAFEKAGLKKNSKTQILLGAPFSLVKKHIEKQFKDGMSWGSKGFWEVDHKIPLASAKNESELRLLCHYTNLQPLLSSINRSKGAKIIPTQMTLTI